ncbi:MAG: bifunctional nuclease family protein [Thermoplasmatota archaeon]
MTSADPFQVKVENVLMSSQGPVVMLAPTNGDYREKVLPIFIDQGQALNIQLALEGQISPRPMTHDLFSAVLNELGAIVQKVVIEDLAQNTFYASLYVSVEKGGVGEVKRFDARPSDCIALAVRVNAPLFVSRKLMDQAGIERGSMTAAVTAQEADDDEDDDDTDVDLGVTR